MALNEVAALGAEDPEMRAIEARLQQLGVDYVYALDNFGNRVHCGVAYNARLGTAAASGANLVLVETDMPAHQDRVVARVDHHRLGDSGYDKGASLAVEASSLGQISDRYNFELTDREMVLAAVDHSPLDAVLGRVPGVSSELALLVKMEEVAKTHDVAIEDVFLDLEVANNDIADLPRHRLGEAWVIDTTDEHLGEPNSRRKLAVQTAAALQDVPILIKFADHADGDDKIMLNGGVMPNDVRYFMNEWAPAHGLTRVFGVPERHYGGGYVGPQTHIDFN